MTKTVNLSSQTPPEKLFITGATGFIGKNLLPYLLEHNYQEISIVHRGNCTSFDHLPIKAIQTNNFTEFNFKPYLSSDMTILHLAGRAHVMKENASNPKKAFFEANVEGTMTLAKQAAEAGVKRFIFFSSVKVNGEKTEKNLPFSNQDLPEPQDYYGLSKHQAEVSLLELSRQTGIQVIIIRLPLVYGPGVKGNVASLIGLLKKQYPLPFNHIYNLRSLISSHNLNDLIEHCIRFKGTDNHVFFASDNEDLSTTGLVQQMAHAMQKKPYLFYVPPLLMRFTASLFRKQSTIDRLLDSLQVDISDTCRHLGWKPKYSVAEALNKMF